MNNIKDTRNVCNSIFTRFVHLILMAMDFDRLCKDILGLESKIRFAGVCDDSGED